MSAWWFLGFDELNLKRGMEYQLVIGDFKCVNAYSINTAVSTIEVYAALNIGGVEAYRNQFPFDQETARDAIDWYLAQQA